MFSNFKFIVQTESGEVLLRPYRDIIPCVGDLLKIDDDRFEVIRREFHFTRPIIGREKPRPFDLFGGLETDLNSEENPISDLAAITKGLTSPESIASIPRRETDAILTVRPV
ncbi:MAG: hypothetical protein U0930_22730 [Pirellulales bacterium]